MLLKSYNTAVKTSGNTTKVLLKCTFDFANFCTNCDTYLTTDDHVQQLNKTSFKRE